ncbi:uncharacterized protein LOC18428260 [Amborella trichopoda]|uniref:Uncharacterized protein n=1 Tax=Amborella trichopoda TaxID=13333 RepID=W1NX43_AMBTC|nr:uncharacterized protein LOC18428260 [Amborella trichopoda]ERN00213.1 hypothetical protein AMTR_s00111p00106220 [Amborella trichopoda]|eukprot:XP_006837359.1 uncharacterized protein LOC18428260 [Amborella trichopoda]
MNPLALTGFKGWRSMPDYSNKIYNKILNEAKTGVEFEEVHIAVLEIINQFNKVMPGTHFDPPSRKVVQEFYKSIFEPAEKKDKKERLKEFIRAHLNVTRASSKSNYLIGLSVPYLSLLGKRAAQKVPQVSMVSVVPDVVFVPFATLLALVGAKFYEQTGGGVDNFLLPSGPKS